MGYKSRPFFSIPIAFCKNCKTRLPDKYKEKLCQKCITKKHVKGEVKDGKNKST